MITRAKNWILRPYLVSARWIEEDSTILVMDTFCVLSSVIGVVPEFNQEILDSQRYITKQLLKKYLYNIREEIWESM